MTQKQIRLAVLVIAIGLTALNTLFPPWNVGCRYPLTSEEETKGRVGFGNFASCGNPISGGRFPVWSFPPSTDSAEPYVAPMAGVDWEALIIEDVILLTLGLVIWCRLGNAKTKPV